MIDHALVLFELEGIIRCEIDEFSHQNVLGSLQIAHVSNGFELTMDPTAGRRTAADWQSALQPGRVARLGVEPEIVDCRSRQVRVDAAVAGQRAERGLHDVGGVDLEEFPQVLAVF